MLLSYIEDITNGVQKIGHFEYKIVDDVKLLTNSVGQYKSHNYIVYVECILRPSVNLKQANNIGTTLDESIISTTLLNLKTTIINEVAYKDAIIVNKIK